MEKFVSYFLKNRSLTILILVLVFFGGIYAYMKMGKLEDAPFTIKQAVVTTSYPGATAMEVREQVSDVIEESIQELGELYYLKTENRDGFSKITVYIKKETRAPQMQQLWDKLRRKVEDVQGKLPSGAGPSVVNDDFGDVLGIFYALKSENCSYREMEDEAEKLKKAILGVKDVAKVEICGLQTPSIDVWIQPSVMASRALKVEHIMQAISKRNTVVKTGWMEGGESRVRLGLEGSFCSVDEIRNLMLVNLRGENVRLGDIAEVQESYQHPSQSKMYVDGVPAVGLAVSTVPDGNVVTMGKALSRCISEYSGNLPEGMDIVCLYDQGRESDVANQGFIVNLILSVVTVVAVLLFFIGLKNGLLVGSGLVFSILATLLYMWTQGIALQRMSLAAIIIAMGMLVDNAIVVFDSALVNMGKGMRKRQAILKAVSSTALPLLAATVIAALTFWPLYLSPDITGEMLYTLVVVVAVSLLFSWVFAVIQTPFFFQVFVPARLSVAAQGKTKEKPSVMVFFERMLGWVVRRKYVVMLLTVFLLLLSIFSFRWVPRLFLPQLNKQYFTVDMWTPEGTRIEETSARALQLAKEMGKFEQVKQISTFVGKTPPRYYLSNASYGPQPNYAHSVVETYSPQQARQLVDRFSDSLQEFFPDCILRVNKFELNSIPEALIDARFCGDDPQVLDSLVEVALEIMRSNPKVVRARNEWGNKTLSVRIPYDPIKMGRMGIGKSDIAVSTQALTDGYPLGVFRDEEKQVPVLLRNPGEHRVDMQALSDLTVWNGVSSAPLSQLTGKVSQQWEWPVVKTYDRRLSMSALCDVIPGATMQEVHSEIRDSIESISLPPGYTFFWDSQFKSQKESVAALVKFFPMAFLLIFIILVALFRNFRQPVIIVLMLPLSLIGMIAGLLVTGFPFGFFCIAGWLGLLGMIIKNVIVLLDEVNVLRASGLGDYESLIQATVSRTRPVLMAASTTVLGMVPLLFDVVFGGMAATIVFGLTFATLLTLFVCPAMYAIFYHVKGKS